MIVPLMFSKHMSLTGDAALPPRMTAPFSRCRSTRLVDRALAFITANYRAPITPRDVASHLGVSRRLIDLRFRQLQHETLLCAITRLRLNALRNLLKEKSGSLKKLSAECGFGSVVRAAHLFKGTFGLSMSAYRKHHCEDALS